VVAKCPVLHPGDVRRFKAVDCLALHHIVDCVVFPQKGERPHPNELAGTAPFAFPFTGKLTKINTLHIHKGSDLDGDLYFVSWEESLFFEKNEKAMDYTPQAPMEVENVTTSDITDFFVNFMRNNHLGIIANTHVRQSFHPLKQHCLSCLISSALFNVEKESRQIRFRCG